MLHFGVYNWEEGTAAMLGYPIQVYRGGFKNRYHDFVSLYGGITIGEWGDPDNGMSGGNKRLPDHLHVIWLSYAEDCLYEIDCEIDTAMIQSYFERGYELYDFNGTLRHYCYNRIIAGFAPGGAVVIWISGVGSRKEIGRYQGYKKEISADEIKSLDYPDKLLFDKNYRQKKMQDENIVPPGINQNNLHAHKSFGVCDLYREKYRWKIIFELPDQSVLSSKRSVRIEFYNGEVEEILNSDFPCLSYLNLPVPQKISFSWTDREGQQYGGVAHLEEYDAIQTYQKITGRGNAVPADLIVRVNRINTFFTICLSNGTDDQFIMTDFIEVFKKKK
jgi:hypothetical protein